MVTYVAAHEWWNGQSEGDKQRAIEAAPPKASVIDIYRLKLTKAAESIADGYRRNGLGDPATSTDKCVMLAMNFLAAAAIDDSDIWKN